MTGVGRADGSRRGRESGGGRKDHAADGSRAGRRTDDAVDGSRPPQGRLGTIATLLSINSYIRYVLFDSTTCEQNTCCISGGFQLII
jgi:hypothetical protein